jgi:hypothetical protein
LPSHHSSKEDVSSDWMLSDYSPPWSSEKKDPEEKEEEEEDEDDADADNDSNGSDSDFDSSRPKRASIFRLSTL